MKFSIIDRKRVIQSNLQMSESLTVAALLAIVGGFFDAYSYIARGHVFANAQTGNIVLLGYYVAHGQVGTALLYFIPICSFAVGVFVAEFIKRRYGANENFHWRQGIIILEILFVIVIGRLPVGTWDIVANAMISYICAMQVEAFRKVNGNAYASTMCTGNLRSGTEHLFRWIYDHDKSAKAKSFHYMFVIFCFIIGAIVGVVLTTTYGAKTVTYSCILLVAVFFLMFTRK